MGAAAGKRSDVALSTVAAPGDADGTWAGLPRVVVTWARRARSGACV